jgi:hypothetical protein
MRVTVSGVESLYTKEHLMDDRVNLELLISLPDAVGVSELLGWATNYRMSRLVDEDPDDPVVDAQFKALVSSVKLRRQIEDILFEIAKGE